MREFVVHAHSHRSSSTAHTTDDRTKYTSAALNAVSNSRKISQNFQIIMDAEDHVQQMFAPVLGVLAILVGRGWMWGREEGSTSIRPPQSTVQIEELESIPDNDGAGRGDAKLASPRPVSESKNDSPQQEATAVPASAAQNEDNDASNYRKDITLLDNTHMLTEKTEVSVADDDSVDVLSCKAQLVPSENTEQSTSSPTQNRQSTKMPALTRPSSNDAQNEVTTIDARDPLPGDMKDSQSSKVEASDNPPPSPNFFNGSCSVGALSTGIVTSGPSIFEMTLKERIALESAATLVTEVMELVAACAEQKVVDNVSKMSVSVWQLKSRVNYQQLRFSLSCVTS